MMDFDLSRLRLRKNPAVICGSNQLAVSMIRCLAADEIPIIVVGHEPISLGSYSRFVIRAFTSPDPKQEEKCFTFLLEMGKKLPQKGVLFSALDDYSWIFGRYRNELEAYYEITSPDGPTVEKICTKKRQLESAWEAGVETPRSFFFESLVQVSSNGAYKLPYPLFIKPMERTAYFMNDFNDSKGFLVRDLEELKDMAPHIDGIPYPMMAQEVIPGGVENLLSIIGYADREGKLDSCITVCKHKQYPPFFGVARIVSTYHNQELKHAAATLLQSIGYRGLFDIEFKINGSEGKPKFLDLNPRLSGFLGISAAAGINLPVMAYRDVLGLDLPSLNGIKPTVWMYLEEALKPANLNWLLLKKKQGFNITFPIWSLSDPLPKLFQLAHDVPSVLRRFLIK